MEELKPEDLNQEKLKATESPGTPSIFHNGEEVVFLTRSVEYKHHRGRRCTVVRALPSETGPMYRVRFKDGLEIAAYAFELAREEDDPASP